MDSESSRQRQSIQGNSSVDNKRDVDEDRASVTSSTHSTHSRDSMDTTAFGESQPLLQDDQPPAYSSRQIQNNPPSSVWLQASHAQYSSYGAIPTRPFSQGRENVAEANPPTTPSDADTERQDPSPDVKQKPKSRFRACWPCRLPRTWAGGFRLLLLLLVLGAAAVLLGNFVFNEIKRFTEHDMLPWPSCSNAVTHRTASFDFKESPNFSIHEAIDNNVLLLGRLDGKVLVRQGSPDQNASIKINVEMQSSYLTFLNHIEFEKGEDRLRIRSTRPAHGGGVFEEDECTVINIVISIRPRSYMSDLTVNAQHMSIELSRSMRLAFGRLTVQSFSGSIANAQRDAVDLPVSQMSIETVRGDIKGRFVLDNELTLQNGAGIIEVEVFTRGQKIEADEMASTFTATADRGNVGVKFSNDYAAGRDYRVEVKTTSGSISGRYVHGSNTLLESISGAIKAKVAPVGAIQFPNNITTHNVFGLTDIEVLAGGSPSSSSPDVMTHTQSNHETGSGSLKLRYPQQWQGTADGKSLTGGLDAAGRDVEITEHSDHTIRLQKGNGTNHIHFSTLSGNADLLIGG